MAMRLQWMMIWFALVTTVLVGCDENERLARYAEQAMESQHKQNEIIAQQSEQVVKESHQLAETAKELVTMDAQARSEMVQAQHDLNEGIHTEPA
jgi:uncharacterized protein YcfL